MNETYKILLAEDDVNLGFVIKDNLEVYGFGVDLCEDGEDALHRYYAGNYDLCILDIMMPKMDGFTLASKIRSEDESIPILFLTAKTLKEDRLQGFLLGGDDYITKPFSIEELICRINVFLKRSRPGFQHKSGGHQIGSYFFDHENLLLSVNDEEKSLTQMEADILICLCEKSGEVIKRKEILQKVWGDDDYFNGRSLDVFISKLRKYLSADPKVQITNHHGVGFKLKVL